MKPDNMGQFKKDRDKLRNQVRKMISQLCEKHGTQMWETTHSVTDWVERQTDENTPPKCKTLSAALAETYSPDTLAQVYQVPETGPEAAAIVLDEETKPANFTPGPHLKAYMEKKAHLDAQFALLADMKAGLSPTESSAYKASLDPCHPIWQNFKDDIKAQLNKPSPFWALAEAAKAKTQKQTMKAAKFNELYGFAPPTPPKPEYIHIVLPSKPGSDSMFEFNLAPNEPYYISGQLMWKLEMSTQKMLGLIMAQGHHDVFVKKHSDKDLVAVTWIPGAL